ncbi:MAG: hypothetical protein Q9166_006219 [cf. Caloplaca sp. 2 TL-2023]
MSSGDHQPTNSPVRDSLGPDIENSFFRSWALRTRNSEFSSTSDVSPGTRTPVTTPISPKSGARPRYHERPPSAGARSASSHGQSDEASQDRRVTAIQRDDSARKPSSIIAYERRLTRTRASLDSLASRASSNASTIAKRTLKLVKGPVLTRTPTGTSVRPPKAKNGVAWKREISGHWLEIRVGKKKVTDVESPDTNVNETPHAPYPTPKAAPHPGSGLSSVTAASKSQHSLNHPAHRSTDSSSLEGKPKKTIVDRTKRLLGIRSSFNLPSSGQSQRRIQSGTGEILERASNALQDLVQQIPTGSPSTSSTSNLSAVSIAGKARTPRRHMLRPGYRRQHTGHSSSSSVRRVMLGAPPVGTPNDDCMYTGPDAQQYFRVDLTGPNAPTYLPSEARRINTPPLHGSGSKVRGFFFDYNAPHSTDEHPGKPWPKEPMNTTILPHRQDNSKLSKCPGIPRSPGALLQVDDGNIGDTNWFRHKVALGEVEEERRTFDLNVPEHLPSSPLCPRHPKHRSGGKGVCVYHGRNKTGPDDVVEEGMWR